MDPVWYGWGVRCVAESESTLYHPHITCNKKPMRQIGGRGREEAVVLFQYLSTLWYQLSAQLPEQTCGIGWILKSERGPQHQ